MRHLPQAATPCWKLLLNDWYDGRIDQTYPVHCYKDALKHLPSDVQTYSSAHDDILRALQSAITKQKSEHKNVSNNTLVPPEQSGGSGRVGLGRIRRRRLGHRGRHDDHLDVDHLDDGRAGPERQRRPRRHGQLGRPILDPDAAADPRRARAACWSRQALPA